MHQSMNPSSPPSTVNPGDSDNFQTSTQGIMTMPKVFIQTQEQFWHLK